MVSHLLHRMVNELPIIVECFFSTIKNLFCIGIAAKMIINQYYALTSMDMMDFLVKQNDQISMSMPECDNINTGGQDED